nr:hypothetical protein [Treponemataceae bacterium]
PKATVAAIVINVLAIISANMILYSSGRLSKLLIKHAEKEHDQAVGSLMTITSALGQAQKSMNIGQQLNSAANSASQSVTEIKELYKGLLSDTENLKNQTVKIKEASQIVSEQAANMGKSAQEQNSSIMETTTAMTEISTNVSNINIIAKKRHEGLAAAVEILDKQEILVQKLVEEVAQVKESSNTIAKFVQTVDDIASQTNLLAMNASIEAAHAGTMGKGFGVIAQQIRKLSEETSHNANKITETLKINTEVVQKTTDSVNEFASSTHNSTEEIKMTVDSMEEIIRGIGEMADASSTILGELQIVVNKSQDTENMIKTVISQVDEQGTSLSDVSHSTSELQDRVDAINEKLSVINKAIDIIYEDAKINEETSSKIASLLN